jgi:hypothetical protein
MNGYLAKLIFTISFENGTRSSQFDEETIYIIARNIEEAYRNAKTYAIKQEEKFRNANDELVEWKFVDVMDLIELEEKRSGSSLYSTTHEADDSESFINLVKHRSQVIQTKFLNFM